MPASALIQNHAVTGVIGPHASEALVREIWPSVTTSAAAANLAKSLQRTIFLAPLGWLVLAPVFGLRLLGVVPFLGWLATRYRLTNRRLGVYTGFPPKLSKDVSLDSISEVRIIDEDQSKFYLSGTLEVLDATGKVILTLPGVPEPESFRHSIMQTAAAWGPLLRS